MSSNGANFLLTKQASKQESSYRINKLFTVFSTWKLLIQTAYTTKCQWASKFVFIHLKLSFGLILG